MVTVSGNSNPTNPTYPTNPTTKYRCEFVNLFCIYAIIYRTLTSTRDIILQQKCLLI